MEIKLQENVKKGKRSNRLGRMEWIDAAFKTLTESGVTSIHVETLAKRLGVTKGSFYWHFKDRTELLDAVLEKWRDQFVIAKVEEQGGDARTRLVNLLNVVPRTRGTTHTGGSMELAMRSWARYDEPARDAVAEVDTLRVEYVRELLEELGFGPKEAEARAFIVYSYVMCQGIFSFDREDGILDRIHKMCTEILLEKPKE
mgnify:CR=1 FL=1